MLPQPLQALFDTLDRRERPEYVAKLVENAATLTFLQRVLVRRASQTADVRSSMSSDFARPRSMASQLSVARSLFAAPADVDPSDMTAMAAYLRTAESEIHKEFGRNDFKKDRLSRKDRKAAGLDVSKRQYNKRFRLAQRMEEKRERVLRETLKRGLTLASKSRLAGTLDPSRFTDSDTACFVAYYVARCNLRSEFTNTSQVRPFDEICAMLLSRCKGSATTDLEAIARVLPDADVLERIPVEARGRLLGETFDVMRSAAELLREIWIANELDRETMVVRKGVDSSTWNATAGAWNKLRSGWFSLLYSLGLEDWLESMCPGKVLRVMAADVAAWHRASGRDLHPDTGPWADLPLPWDVLRGAKCTAQTVAAVCGKWGVDPVKSGWVAPPPPRRTARFTPTPELVHGVEVSSPALATLLRKLGAFSGKTPPSTADP